ncbi:MAG TPA: hypothetical protein VLV78_14750 [Thermoanaerobaculia bacterium]|nr:hypothetical protein [Thermoanaerobaculia bacterium]
MLMSVSPRTDMSTPGRPASKLFVPLFTAAMGVAAFANAASSPRFAMFRAIDVVRLIACGMCFGAAVVALVMSLRGPRPG